MLCMGSLEGSIRRSVANPILSAVPKFQELSEDSTPYGVLLPLHSPSDVSHNALAVFRLARKTGVGPQQEI